MIEAAYVLKNNQSVMTNKAQFEFGLRSARFWIKSNTDIWTAQLNRYNIYWKFGTKEENTKKTRRKEEKTKCKEENNETQSSKHCWKTEIFERK